MTRLPPAGLVALIAYVAAIVAANVLTNELGLVSVGFGLTVTAGTYAAGLALLARDYVQRFAGVPWVLFGIAFGGVLSWLSTTNARLALASTVAFVGAELLDLGVFSALWDRLGMFGSALASNVISAPVDTLLFLSLAGFPVTAQTVAGQFVGKVLWATLVPLLIVEGIRVLSRQPDHAESS